MTEPMARARSIGAPSARTQAAAQPPSTAMGTSRTRGPPVVNWESEAEEFQVGGEGDQRRQGGDAEHDVVRRPDGPHGQGEQRCRGPEGTPADQPTDNEPGGGRAIAVSAPTLGQ